MVWNEDDEVGIPGALPPHNDAGMLGYLLLMSVTWLQYMLGWVGRGVQTLIELSHFNSNYIHYVNRKRRKKHKKALQRGTSSTYNPLKKLHYWMVLKRNSGCLLVECSTRNGAGTTQIITINFNGLQEI